MNQIQDKAIVISGRDYREYDRLVRLFTKSHGPLTALARGAKRSLKRFCGSLEPFSLLEVELTINHDGLSILHNTLINASQQLFRKDLERFANASYICELVDRFLPDHLPNQRLFRLLANCLDHLGNEELLHTASSRRFFEINLLNILGYRPDLKSLATTLQLSESTISLLNSCLTTGRISAVQFNQNELNEAGPFLDNSISCHLDRPLKSLEFLREINRL